MEKEDKTNETKYIVALAIVILFLWAACWALLKDDSERGTFGDMFGSINALFSGFAFLGVIYAILLQRQELSLQRKELQLTRDELRKTAEAQEKAEKALTKQAISMEKTQQINSLSVAIESLENRISRISLSGLTHEVEIKRKKKEALINKLGLLVKKLDGMIEELLI
ncbi:hypothetical protein [Aeromonas caviae]|uniref:hypothetical protein n=1 Tax=Aeromonas caviae TaxID=648 RepID=UPI002B4A867C|nr:hypothetical protein [Aeromonas caviae]